MSDQRCIPARPDRRVRPVTDRGQGEVVQSEPEEDRVLCVRRRQFDTEGNAADVSRVEERRRPDGYVMYTVE